MKGTRGGALGVLAATTAAVALVSPMFAAADTMPTVPICVPPPYATLITQHGRFNLRSSDSTCYSIDRDSGQVVGVVSRDALIPASGAPRFALRRGEVVRFRLWARPEGLVRLDVDDARGAAIEHYRLAPRATTTWRVRGHGGLMALSARLTVRGPGGFLVNHLAIYTTHFAIR
jgi:hypothetical protein